MCQHKAPHREWEPALRHLGHDDDRMYPEPAHPLRRLRRPRPRRARSGHDHRRDHERPRPQARRPAQPHPDQRSAWDAYYEPRNAAFREAKLEGEDLVRWKYNRYMHDYLGCLKAVDESVGRLLDYLDESGLAENTIVVYAADQGTRSYATTNKRTWLIRLTRDAKSLAMPSKLNGSGIQLVSARPVPSMAHPGPRKSSCPCPERCGEISSFQTKLPKSEMTFCTWD